MPQLVSLDHVHIALEGSGSSSPAWLWDPTNAHGRAHNWLHALTAAEALSTRRQGPGPVVGGGLGPVWGVWGVIGAGLGVQEGQAAAAVMSSMPM